MLSKISVNILLNSKRLGSVSVLKSCFSTTENKDKNENKKEESESTGRNTDPDPENIENENTIRKINKMKIVWRAFWMGSFCLFSYNFFLLKKSNDPFHELGYVSSFFNAAKYVDTKYHNFYHFMTKPPIDKLLPDFPQIPGMMMDPPKTLVLNLTGTLIHTNYVMGKGMEIMKRPGLKQFFNQLAGLYEIVIFSDEDTMYSYSIAEKLDPKRMFLSGCFGKESASFEGGKYIKDLSYLNRDLKKVIVIELNPEKINLHKENGIYLKEFNGDKDDKALYELLPFLQHCAKPEVKDIRAELKKYGQSEPGKKYLEEIKQKQKVLSERKGISSIFKGMANQNNPHFPQKH